MSYLKAITDRLATASKYGDDMQSSRIVVYEDCLHLTVEHHKDNKGYLLTMILQAMLKNGNDYKLPLFSKIKALSDADFNENFTITNTNKPNN